MSLIAVIDTETTGKHSQGTDRVVELGVVIINENGKHVTDFCSLVNPQRDVGPTWIHKIRASHVLHAPRFADIAAELSELFADVTVVAGHNVGFDTGFLRAEYERLGVRVPNFEEACTKHICGGASLREACDDLGLPYEEARSHSALYDALLAADILRHTALRDGSLRPAAKAQSNSMPVPQLPRLTTLKRSDVPSVCSNPSGFFTVLQTAAWGVLKQLGRDLGASHYLRDLLAELCDGTVFADRCLSVAVGSRATKGNEEAVKREIARTCAKFARGYNRTSEADVAGLQRLCNLLAVDESEVTHRGSREGGGLQPGFPPLRALRGKEVCFSGESCMLYCGDPLTPEVATVLCERAGIAYTRNLRSEAVGLVTEDVMSLSTKASDARKRGVPIVAEKAFWALVCKDVVPRHCP